MTTMKLTTCLFALFTSVQLLQAKTYVLDDKDYYPPKGIVFEKKSILKIENGKISANTPNGKVNGEAKTLTTKVEVLTHLSVDRLLLLVNKSISNEFTMGGKIIPKTMILNPLTDVAVFYEKENGVWTATPSDGEFTARQEQEANKRSVKLNAKKPLYGYQPRKLEETWEMGEALLTRLTGEGQFQKTKGKITLQNIAQVDGHKCAKLLCKIDTIGIKGNRRISLKGEIIIWRSLEYQVDMKVRGKLTTVSDSNKMKITGDLFIEEDVTIKEPAISK